MPLNVVAGGMLDGSVPDVVVVAAEMGGQIVFGHAATIGPGPLPRLVYALGGPPAISAGGSSDAPREPGQQLP